MIEHVAKLQAELAKDLKAAMEEYAGSQGGEDATKKAFSALFRNMDLLNAMTCQILELSIHSSERLQIFSSWLEDQNKLMSATKSRLEVFGGPKG